MANSGTNVKHLAEDKSYINYHCDRTVSHVSYNKSNRVESHNVAYEDKAN
jgi:hypothetical protein